MPLFKFIKEFCVCVCVVDNVLLSKDKTECFLCDFGLSEMLDRTGYSTKTFRGNTLHTYTHTRLSCIPKQQVTVLCVCLNNVLGNGLRGTESHMSPEVARGDPRSDKADVWSSCCMLLHMLSGHQPWTRYYTHPLCLKVRVPDQQNRLEINTSFLFKPRHIFP